MNGDNNKKMNADKSMLQYVSYGRSLLRMMRFMDYLNIMFSEVNNDRNMKLSDACSKAYRTALYPYHRYLNDIIFQLRGIDGSQDSNGCSTWSIKIIKVVRTQSKGWRIGLRSYTAIFDADGTS